MKPLAAIVNGNRKARPQEKKPHNLGELILSVDGCSQSREEMLATVSDLLASGRVRFHSGGRRIRARLIN